MMYYETLSASVSTDSILDRIRDMVREGKVFDCAVCGKPTHNVAVYIPHKGKEHILGNVEEGKRKIVIYALCYDCSDNTDGDSLESLVIRNRQ